MKTIINPRILNGEINAIPSKSDLHRKLICAALSEKKTRLQIKSESNEISEDITATITCLKQMGASINQRKKYIDIIPIDKTVKTDFPYTMNCGESGSTLRFLLPVAAALGRPFTITGEGRLPERPVGELVNVLRNHDVSIKGDKLPLHVSGKLSPGKYFIDGNITSQYISGLLFALPLLNDDSQIILTSKLESKPYVEMTRNCLRMWGINTEEDKDKYLINGNSFYSSPCEMDIEGDWSNASFWLCAGTFSDNGITVHNLDPHSVQADRAIITALKKMGANVLTVNDSVTVKKGPMKGINFDVSECPDTVPAIASIMSVSKGQSQISNGARLRIKESDRLKTTSSNLNILGANIEELDDSLAISGVDSLNGGTVNGYNDHRIVMAMSVASIVCKNRMIIEDSQAVNKSYPAFFRDFNYLGGDASGI